MSSRPIDRLRRRPSSAAPVLLLALLSACGGSKPTPAPAPAVAPTPAPAQPRDTTPPAPPPPPAAVAPFGELASRMVVVFPAQRFAVGDSGWILAAGVAGRPRVAAVDSALTAALRDRGLETTWSLPPNTSRVAQREVMNRTDPRALSTAGLGPSRRPNDVDLREPLGSQLRAIIALVPEARLVLLPLEARVKILADGQRQATLRMAFLDGRMATVIAFPDVSGTAASSDAAALQSAAMKFADLVVAP